MHTGLRDHKKQMLVKDIKQILPKLSLTHNKTLYDTNTHFINDHYHYSNLTLTEDDIKNIDFIYPALSQIRTSQKYFVKFVSLMGTNISPRDC